MYFMATSSFVTLFLISLATPKLPEPKSLTASYLSIVTIITEKNRDLGKIGNNGIELNQKSMVLNYAIG